MCSSTIYAVVEKNAIHFCCRRILPGICVGPFALHHVRHGHGDDCHLRPGEAPTIICISRFRLANETKGSS
jgi:hypothetical protein